MQQRREAFAAVEELLCCAAKRVVGPDSEPMVEAEVIGASALLPFLMEMPSMFSVRYHESQDRGSLECSSRRWKLIQQPVVCANILKYSQVTQCQASASAIPKSNTM